MGIIRRPWLTRPVMGNLARTRGLHPYSFTRRAMGFFYDHRESGPRFNVSSKRRYNTLPVSLFRHKFVTSLQPNHWRYQKSHCSLTSRCREIMLTKIGGDRDEDSRNVVHEIYTECVFQTIHMARLPVGWEQIGRIDCQHEVIWLMKIYRWYEILVTVRW